MTPEQRYSGKLPTMTHLKKFGSIAFVHIPKTNQKKLITKTLRCIFFGYDTESKVYRLYSLEQKKILLMRDIVIDETRVGFHYLSKAKTEPITYLPSQLAEIPEPSQDPLETSNPYHIPSEFDLIDQNTSPPSSPNSPQKPTSPLNQVPPKTQPTQRYP